MTRKTPAAAPPFISQQVTAARRFYLNLKPRPRSEFTVICGGWERCSADYVIDRSTFPYLSIEYVVAGAGELVLNGQRHALAPGVVFTYGPGVAQRFRSSPTDCLHKYFVDFLGARAKRQLSEFGLSPGSVLQIAQPAELRGAFERLIEAASVHDRFAEQAARLHLEFLFIAIARGARAAPSSPLGAAAAFDRCRRYLDANIRTLRTVEEAAAACHIDVAYLTRLFRRFQDETPYKYLQRRKVQWAAERLQSTGSLVKAIADDLGVDPFQFSRMFKRVYGISPSTFLKQR